jgi:hypothetical protein
MLENPRTTQQPAVVRRRTLETARPLVASVGIPARARRGRGGILARVRPRWAGILAKARRRWGGILATARRRAVEARTARTGPMTLDRAHPAAAHPEAPPVWHRAPEPAGHQRRRRPAGGRWRPLKSGNPERSRRRIRRSDHPPTDVVAVGRAARTGLRSRMLPEAWVADPTARTGVPAPKRTRWPGRRRAPAEPCRAEAARRDRCPARAPIRSADRAGWGRQWDGCPVPAAVPGGGVAYRRAVPAEMVGDSRRWGPAGIDRRRPAPQTASHRSEWTAAAERTRWDGRRLVPGPAGNGRRGTAGLGRPTWPRPAARRRNGPRTSYAPPPSGSAGPAVDPPWPPHRSAPIGDRPSPPDWPCRVATVPNRTGLRGHSESRCPSEEPAPPPSILDLWLAQIRAQAAKGQPQVQDRGEFGQARSRTGALPPDPPGRRRHRAGTSTRAHRR